MKNKKSLKDLDRNELIIKWGDEIIFNVNHFGEVSRDSFMLDNVFDVTPPTQEEIEWRKVDPARKIRDHVLSRVKISPLQLDAIGQELESYLAGVKNHLLSNEYIKEPLLTSRFWQVTEKGKLMKELGGHDRYVKYRRREINVLKNQAKINFWLIVATGAAAVMPFIAARIFTTKVYNTNILPAPVYRPDIRIDSVWLHQQVDAALRRIKSNPDTVVQLRLRHPNEVAP